jgi:hypothetical protein
MKRAVCFIAALVLLPAGVAPLAGDAQKKGAKGGAGSASLAWDRVPRCLAATVAGDAPKWTTDRHELKTSKGVVAIQPQGGELSLTLDGQPIVIGSDENGHPITLGDWSLEVWAVPDCAQPAYLFIEQKSAGAGSDSRQWFFDPARPRQANDAAVVEFQGHYGTDALLTYHDAVVIVANDVGEPGERTFQYYGSPLYAFLEKGAPPKYLGVIGKSNAAFFEDAGASAGALKIAGRDDFDALRSRTAVGDSRVFRGRYLVVSGAADGDYEHHGAVVIDMIRDATYYVLCDDDREETGVIVSSSRASGGDDLLEAFRFAGFILRWTDEGGLACAGECHDERALNQPYKVTSATAGR